MAAVLQGTPVTNNTGGTAVTSVTFSATVAAGTDTVMAVCIQAEGDGSGGGAVTSVTFNGDALTLVDEQNNTTWSFSEIWRRIAPDVTTANVVVNVNSPDKFITGVYVADGVDQTTPFRTPVKATGSTTSASVTVTGVVTGDLLIDSLSIDSGSHAAAVGANQTERWDLNTSNANTGASSTQAGADGGVMSWTWTGSAPYSIVATAFIAVAGAATIAGDEGALWYVPIQSAV